jgi:hypothetical protein
MKILMILAPLLVIILTFLMYKKEGDVKKTIIGFMLLWALISLAIVGNLMRAVSPLFISHIIALFISYAALIYFILRGKLIWLALALPMVTMLIYLIIVWIGNEHLPPIG